MKKTVIVCGEWAETNPTYVLQPEDLGAEPFVEARQMPCGGIATRICMHRRVDVPLSRLQIWALLAAFLWGFWFLFFWIIGVFNDA